MSTSSWSASWGVFDNGGVEVEFQRFNVWKNDLKLAVFLWMQFDAEEIQSIFFKYEK